jgi:hypothetical protein
MRELKIFFVTYAIVMVIMYLLTAFIHNEFNPWMWDNTASFEFVFFGNIGGATMGMTNAALMPKE